MSWLLSTFLEPNFDGALMDALHMKGGFRIVNTQSQMLSIPNLYRTLNDKEATIVYIRATKLLYQLVNNPSSNTTTITDWEPIELGGSGVMRPVGEWDPNTNDPLLSDAGAAGRNGEFYYVIEVPTTTTYSISGLFENQSVSLINGAMIMSVGTNWIVIASTASWDSLVKPSVITDYVNGIVIPHTHSITDITDWAGITGDFYTVADTADHTIPFDDVSNLAITEVEFLRNHYYRKTELDSQFLRKVGDAGVFLFTFANNQGIDSDGTAGTDVLNIGTQNADVINIGRAGGIVNIAGTVNYNNQTNLAITNKLIRLNVNGAAASGFGVGFEIEEGGTGVITGYLKTNGTRDGYLFNTPASAYDAEMLFSSLTASRTYTFPNLSGILATIPSAGIPLSNGTGWNASITNNSANWNTAFGWGNHAGLYWPLTGTATLTGNTTIYTQGNKFTLTPSSTPGGMQMDFDYGVWNIYSPGGEAQIQVNSSDNILMTGNLIRLNNKLDFNGGSVIWTLGGDSHGDIYYNNTGAFTRLAAGTNGHILTLASGIPSWAAPTSLTDPMTTRGDLIYRNASNVTSRLAVGAANRVLTSDGVDVSWQLSSGSGHAIYNGGSLLTQRANLKVQNGLTASDSTPDTLVQLGGELLANTNITGAYTLSLNTTAVSLFASAPALNSGDKIMFMGVATTPPSAPPAAGVYIWVSLVNGVYELKIMDSSGNIKGIS